MPTTLDDIAARVGRALGLPDARSRLASLRGTDLTGLLLAVARDRAAARTAPDVLRAFERDRFVAPQPIDPEAELAVERRAYALAEGFAPLALSPVCPLGAVSALGPVDQNHVEATTRGREVLADPTNVMALEAATRRRAALGADPRSRDRVDLCASARAVRSQAPDLPGFFPHFRLFALVSADRAGPSASTEIAMLRDHVAIHARLVAEQGASPIVTLFDRTGRHLDALAQAVTEALPDGATLHRTTERAGATTYYPTLSFQIDAALPSGERWNLSDGGVVDWTARALANGKERCAISATGTQRLVGLAAELRS